MAGSGSSDFSILNETPPRRENGRNTAANNRDDNRDGSRTPSTPRPQKRKLLEMEEEDEDDDAPSRINELPSDIKAWVRRVKLSKLRIDDLAQFGLDYKTETAEDFCPLHLYRPYAQSLLQTQLAHIGIQTTNQLREEVVPPLKRARSMLTRIEGDVKDLKKAAESKLTEADTFAIQRIIASVFHSADVQLYSEKGDLPKVITIYLERNPDLVGPAFAERYKTGEVHFLALVSSVIKKKVNNLRSHIRDKIHWSLGLDANRSKQDLYDLYMKLTKSYGVPLTKERVLRIAYIRLGERQTCAQCYIRCGQDEVWRLPRHEKGISKAGSEDNDIRSAFKAAATSNANDL
ncbi:unnamed protein product [Tilletia caries]|uniref:Uncharacterized protein n=1 Tax=Tilletia caries TaxID=13290 RepID=A0ABN7IY54_9BASI|nr:unnamed protein product [Tilletia caries]